MLKLRRYSKHQTMKKEINELIRGRDDEISTSLDKKKTLFVLCTYKRRQKVFHQL